MKMRFLIPLLALCLPLPGAAADGDLYTGEVVVESGAAAGPNSFRRALAAVLFKHTGDESAARALADAAGAPEQLMLGYQFRELEVPRFDDESAPERRLLVEFDPPSIDRLFAGQRIARWSRERPGLLVWLVVEDEQGLRFMPQEAEWLRFALNDGAARRGLLLELPLFDAGDLRQVSPEDVRNLRIQGALQGAARYGLDGALLIDLRQAGDDRWLAHWRWQVGDRQARYAVDGERPEEVISQGLSRLAIQLAASYRSDDPVASAGQQRLVVSGLRSEVHYAELLAFLQDLSMVSRVHVLRARDDRIVFGLDLNAGGLEEAVALGRLLEPEPASAAEPDTLHYHLRW